jgi:hypothetical protein
VTSAARASEPAIAAKPNLEAPSVDAQIASPAGQARIQQFEQVWKGDNAKPINVYGKIVDQFGQPVVGAKVNGGTLLYLSFERSGGEKFTTVTDSQGLFSFTDLHGVRFGFGVEKAGYEYDPRKYLDWWDHYKPDPRNPAVFVMWKLQGAEPMCMLTQTDGYPSMSRQPVSGHRSISTQEKSRRLGT